MRPILLSLFDFSGVWAAPWLDTHEVVLMDTRHPAGWTRGGRFHVFGGDALDWFEALADRGVRDPDVILAAPPCTHFSKAGARLWAEKDADGRTAAHLALVREVLRFVDEYAPRVWALENPPGRLSNRRGSGLMQDHLGSPTYSFDPCDHGDAHKKRTHLWGRFAVPEKHPVEPAPISRLGKSYGNRNYIARLSSRDERRRITPAGFARDFFEANKLR